MRFGALASALLDRSVDEVMPSEFAMPLSHAQILHILLALLTPVEREQAVAYLTERPVAIERFRDATGKPLDVPWETAVGFIDAEPMANWGHRSRYILINRETGETRSIEARFPPFSKADPGSWRLVYKAARVPDAFVMVPPMAEKEQ